MSVGLYKYLGNIYDRNSKLILSENISSQQFYEKYWEKAIYEMKIKYVQDGAEFDISKKEIVLEELELLLNWAEQNLQYKDLNYMKTRIKNLQKVIMTELCNEKDIFYIF